MLQTIVRDYPAVLFVAAFAGFTLSSTTGVGGALVLLPFATARFGANAAVAILTPVMLANNGVKLLLFRQAIHRRALGHMLVGGLPAAALGAFASSHVPGRILEKVVGGVILAFVAHGILVGEEARRPISERALVPWGAATGLVSSVVGAGGPTNAMALTGFGLTREAFVGTGAAVSAGLQLVKLPVFVGTGTFTADLLPMALGLSAVTLVAGFTGRGILRRLDDRRFRIALYVALAGLGVGMLV